MPELPEITVLAGQMSKELEGKRVAGVEVKQPKNLNMPVEKFVNIVRRKTVQDVSGKGKWLFMRLNPEHFLLLNLGMGAELLHYKTSENLPNKYQFRLEFSDKTGFTIHFWWFGYVHLVHRKDMAKHKLTANLGIPPLHKDFTFEHFKKILTGKKVGVKNFLLDQKNMAGIGNVYAQDILFKAKLHPNRKVSTMSEKETKDLYNAVHDVLGLSVKLGGLAYERDFYGRKGGFTTNEFLVGYKQGKPCPACNTKIEKIRTGSTSSYICPKCQAL